MTAALVDFSLAKGMGYDCDGQGATYKILIRPIPPKVNLASVAAQLGCKTCDEYAVIVPDRRKAQNCLIRTSYDRVDLWQDFPALKSSAKLGCGMCRVRRSSNGRMGGWTSEGEGRVMR